VLKVPLALNAANRRPVSSVRGYVITREVVRKSKIPGWWTIRKRWTCIGTRM